MKSSLGLWLFHDLNWCQNWLAILPISLFKTSNAFVYKCQFTSHRDVEDQRLVMVLVNTQRLNNRLHSEPQTQCLGESASGSRYLLGPHVVSPLSHPATRIISLRNLPDRSHCDCLSFRPPGSVHSSLSWKLMFTSNPRLWAREITGFPAAWSSDGDAVLTDAPVKAGRRRVLGIEDESRLMWGVGCPDVLFAGLSIMKLSCGLRFARRWDCEKASLFKPRHLVMGLPHNYTNTLSQVNFCQ